MYSQYETTVINRRRLHELLAWVNRKYHLDYEVVQENRDIFYVKEGGRPERKFTVGVDFDG